ncbi:Zn-dependent protease with chaperone function [Rhizomicrobium palustre]|uniref:Zn-dependent protease with chaperone function n=1 Tax=Rhizomicrobium palustre TaxID=189966 RepID=A0A846N0F4_9PROT|nr:M48 family metalloprotease [Rhizomicrobium palustre]NIK89043.1 Zn-dependent protease with chaperone function [Rhizomicrobium palustre]
MRKIVFLLLAGAAIIAQSGAQSASALRALPGAEAALVQSNWFWAGGQILSLAIPALVLFSGLGARLRHWAAFLARGNWYGTITLMAVFFLALNAVLVLPYDVWHRYAVRSSFPGAGWWIGEGIGFLVRCVAAALFYWLPYLLIARSPKYWWAYAAAASIPATFIALIVLPVWVDPLTTSYKPLADQNLYTEIESMSARCRVAHIPVFVGGNDTTVVGLGPTSRIILGTDLLRGPKDQLIFTVGHELKHYLLGDNYKSILVIFAILLLGFYLTHVLGNALIARFHARFGFSELSDPASLPLGIFILTLSWLCALPLFNAYGRHIEFEADRFGLELTHENHGLAQLELDAISMGDVPDWGPFFRIFRATHPTDGERIRFANSYRPWARGERPVYADVCKQPPAQ